MTTQFPRWRKLCGALALVVLGALWLSVLSGAARAQPFAAVVMDARTGEVLHSTNANTRLHPASLTKMMTLYIAFEAIENGEIDLDTRVRISAAAAREQPSRLGLRAGQRISFRHLIRAAALRSANDAATAIAEALEGSVPNFAARMNRTARALGMTRTNFVNAHGLTAEGHMSTATDMTILGRHLYFDFPEYYNIFSRLTEDAGIARVSNTNRRLLTSYEGADGIKTGFTVAAGYNLTAMAQRGTVRIIVTVMGGRSSAHRYQQVTALLDRGFREAPRRAETRRPARPSYVPGSDDAGSGVAAGRVVRLQTAPSESLFPRPRPDPNAPPPPPEVIAAIESSVAGALSDLLDADAAEAAAIEAAGPDGDPDLPETGDEPVRAVAVAPERSLVPPARPEVAPAATPEVALAEAVAVPGTDTADAAEVAQQFSHDAVDVAALAAQDGGVSIPGLPPIAQDGAVVAEAGSVAPEGQAEVAAVAEAPATITVPLPETGPETGPEGLPDTLPEAPVLATAIPSRPARVGLVVDENGRILWRDEELLVALEAPEQAETIVPPAIVLTSASDAEPPAPEAPAPQVVALNTNAAERTHGVSLGAFASSFDAERVLLRLSLSEGSTLGSGERRVVSQGGRIEGRVMGLTADEAQIACGRLNARGQSCEVIQP